MALRRLRKELQDLKETLPHGILRVGPILTKPRDTGEKEGEGKAEQEEDWDLFHWEARLEGPAETPFAGGVFLVDLVFPTDYPFKEPKSTFKTPVHHPNLTKTGQHCLDLNWSPALTAGKLLTSLVSLLRDPDPHDPLQPDIAEQYMRDRDTFDRLAREWTARYAEDKDHDLAPPMVKSAYFKG
jgi:ubiquitin-protein ligase